MPQTYVAYIKKTRPTGKKIAKMLGVGGFGIRPPDEYRLRVLIRWGSRKPMPDADLTFNSPDAIARASDKIKTFEVLRDAGITTVGWYNTFARALRNSPTGYVLGRSRTGHGGKDIQVYSRETPPPPGTDHHFYSPWLHANREYRVHVVGDKVVRVQGKYLDYPDRADGGFIRNYEHGYRFREPKQRLHRRREQDAIAAVRALGLDFGAVDMLVFGDRQSYILEVNSAPACSPLTARCYVGEIAQLVYSRSGGVIRLAPEVLETELGFDEVEDDYPGPVYDEPYDYEPVIVAGERMGPDFDPLPHDLPDNPIPAPIHLEATEAPAEPVGPRVPDPQEFVRWQAYLMRVLDSQEPLTTNYTWTADPRRERGR